MAPRRRDIAEGGGPERGGEPTSERRGKSTGGVSAARADRFLADEDAQRAVEARHPDGLTSAQIVEAFTREGVHLSEATFRKWVQLGLLPRSRRVGRKGKHQGSLGLYPKETVRRIATIKRLMGESLTIEDITRSLRFRDQIDAIERGLRDLFEGFSGALGETGERMSDGDRRQAERSIEQLGKQATDLVGRIQNLERRIVEPLEREAKARAFGSGTSGGASDLL